MNPPVPLVLVLGAAGAGKTRFIAGRVRARPAGERWAVLLAERGRSAIAAEDPGLTIRELDSACLCCVGAVSLRVALTRIVREVRPARIYLEAPGLEHAGRIVRMFDDFWLAQAVRRESVVLVAADDRPLAPTLAGLATEIVRPAPTSPA